MAGRHIDLFFGDVAVLVEAIDVRRYRRAARMADTRGFVDSYLRRVTPRRLLTPDLEREGI